MPGKLVSKMSRRECFTLNERDTIKIASQKLEEKKISCMPVVDNNKKVIGILSEKDMSQFIYKERFNLSISVSQIMTKDLVTCDLNTSVTELMSQMTEKKKKTYFNNGRQKTFRNCIYRRCCKSFDSKNKRRE